jgi:hypothetical protein
MANDTFATFDLLFLEPGPTDLAGPPVSHVFVKNSIGFEYRGVNKDLKLITPRAESGAELGKYIDVLCEELQKIKRAAAQKYGEAEDRRRGRRPAP